MIHTRKKLLNTFVVVTAFLMFCGQPVDVYAEYTVGDIYYNGWGNIVTSLADGSSSGEQKLCPQSNQFVYKCGNYRVGFDWLKPVKYKQNTTYNVKCTRSNNVWTSNNSNYPCANICNPILAGNNITCSNNCPDPCGTLVAQNTNTFNTTFYTRDTNNTNKKIYITTTKVDGSTVNATIQETVFKTTTNRYVDDAPIEMFERMRNFFAGKTVIQGDTDADVQTDRNAILDNMCNPRNGITISCAKCPNSGSVPESKVTFSNNQNVSNWEFHTIADCYIKEFEDLTGEYIYVNSSNTQPQECYYASSDSNAVDEFSGDEIVDVDVANNTTTAVTVSLTNYTLTSGSVSSVSAVPKVVTTVNQ